MRKTATISIVMPAVFVFTGVLLIFSGAEAVSAPNNVSAVQVASGQVQVSWNGSSTDAGYRVYRNNVLITNVNATSYTDSGLSAGGYTYSVAAYDSVGNTSPQSLTSFVNVTVDTVSPTAPTVLTAVANPATSSYVMAPIVLNWGGATDDVGVVGYNVYRNGVIVNQGSPITATTYTDYVVAGTYRYWVVAYDGAHNFSDPSQAVYATIVVDNTPPGAPASFTATLGPLSEVDLIWSSANDNVGMGGYYIYRDSAQIASVASSVTTYADTGVSSGNHIYNIASYDLAGNISSLSLMQPSVTITTDTTPPSVPYNIITTVGTSTVVVSWAPSFDNVALGGYNLYRDGNAITSIASTTTTYMDTGLVPGTYYYSLDAYDAAGNTSIQSYAASAVIYYIPGSSASSSTQSSSSTTTSSLSATPAATQPVSNPLPPTSSSGGVFTAYLSYGSNSDQVKTLQMFLAERGYMGSSYATGFYGSITQAAVKKFQCDQSIVCDGTPSSTGWGNVGINTRAALNSLYGTEAPVASSPVQLTVDNSALVAKIGVLLEQIKALQAKVQAIAAASGTVVTSTSTEMSGSSTIILAPESISTSTIGVEEEVSSTMSVDQGSYNYGSDIISQYEQFINSLNSQ